MLLFLKSAKEDIVDKSLKRFSTSLSHVIGVNIEPYVFVSAVTILLLIVEVVFLVTFFAFSSCNPNIANKRNIGQGCSAYHVNGLPTIYVVTPTYDRHVQKAELTRLSQTLLLVSNIHWLLIEDSDRLTVTVSKFIKKLKASYCFETITHLHASTPENFKLKPGDPNWKYPKGVWQRNKALEWIRTNSESLDLDGIVYFADDDNTYDLILFDEMRTTKVVSVWPVGFAGGLLVEKPIVDKATGKVKSFNSLWKPERPFPIDMAGFAVSMRLLLDKRKVAFSSNGPIGYVESNFLSQLITIDNLEPKADNCNRILVWHTKTSVPALHEEKKLTVASRHGVEW